MKKKKKKTLKDFNILHMRNINDNHMMYGSWDMKCNKQNFLSFRVMFCPFTPLTSQKITIFLKMTTTPGDIIILHKCTINDNHMIYGFRDMKCNSQNILWFWAIFCHFTPLTTQKIKILKKKNHLEISSFHTSVPKIMIIYYNVPVIGQMTDVIVNFHFGLFFTVLPH